MSKKQVSKKRRGQLQGARVVTLTIDEKTIKVIDKYGKKTMPYANGRAVVIRHLIHKGLNSELAKT